MKSLRKYIGSLFIIFVQLIASGQNKTEILTQQEFIDIILKHHPIAQQADITIEKAKADILIAKGGFDPILSTGIAQKTFDGTSYYNHIQPEIRVPTWYGIELVAGAEYLDGSRTNSEETLGQSSYAGLVVPLAKNLLMDKRRAALQTAKIFRTLSEVEKRATLNNLLLDALKIYWDWSNHFQQLKIINNAVIVNEKRTELVKIAVRQGDRPALDTIEAITQLQFFQLHQNETALLLQNAKLNLSTYLWKEELSAFTLPDNIIPEEAWVLENLLNQPLPLINEMLDQIRTNHPEIQQYGFYLQSLEIEKKLQFQELLPKIDFKYNQLGKGYNMLNAKSGPLFENNFQYGISFGIPLRLSHGRGEYRKARLKINETVLNRSLKTLLIENKVKAYYNELATLRNQLTIMESAYQNFMALQRGEELKFFNGESSLFILNARETKALESLQKLLKTKTEYYKSLYNLRWAAGMLN